MVNKLNCTPIKKPKVAAVIFFYNDERIYELIYIACNQIYQFDKIIIYSDGSDANYNKKIRNLCQLNPKISYYSNKINRGIAYAMESAILNVREEYFYLMSCGDIYKNLILKDFNNLNWENSCPGIIASGVYTQVEGVTKKNLYQQHADKGRLYMNQEYAHLARKHTNLFYGGGCIVKTRLGKDVTKFFGKLEWASDFFMYHYAAFKFGVIFTETVSMCNLIHKNRYCNNNNINIVMEFIKSSKIIDLNFYNYCYNSAILPRYSIYILLKIFLSSEFRGYISANLIYKCLLIDTGKLLKQFIPIKLKNYLRFLLGI